MPANARRPALDAVAIAPPVATHYPMPRPRFPRPHVSRKPFTASVREPKIVALAERAGLALWLTHVVYTGAVRKIKEIVAGGELGELLYFDSTRINLGLFQHDINVVWDLAPHDLSIMDFVIERQPESVAATGSCHIERGIENIAYVMLQFPERSAHFHSNGSRRQNPPHTSRGSLKMVVTTTSSDGEIGLHSGVTSNESFGRQEDAYRTLVSYARRRVGAKLTDRGAALRLRRVHRSDRKKATTLTDARRARASWLLEARSSQSSGRRP